MCEQGVRDGARSTNAPQSSLAEVVLPLKLSDVLETRSTARLAAESCRGVAREHLSLCKQGAARLIRGVAATYCSYE
jgi:hypothetical protein